MSTKRKPASTSRKVSTERRKRARALKAEGYSTREIASELGVDRSTIGKFLRDAPPADAAGVTVSTPDIARIRAGLEILTELPIRALERADAAHPEHECVKVARAEQGELIAGIIEYCSASPKRMELLDRFTQAGPGTKMLYAAVKIGRPILVHHVLGPIRERRAAEAGVELAEEVPTYAEEAGGVFTDPAPNGGAGGVGGPDAMHVTHAPEPGY
jgi:transcriptional regulator with XRE-family HTH domain